MAIKYYTGFESDNTILAADGIIFTLSGVSTVERHRTISGRGGAQSVVLSAGNHGVRIPAFTAGVAEEIGVAVRHETGASWTMTFLHSGGSENCSIRKAADGFLRAHRSATVLATSGAILPGETWNWLKVIVTVREAASGGRIQVFINGSTSAFLDTGAGVDCRQLAEDDFASVEFLGSNTFDMYVDDYIQAGASTLPDRELFIQIIRPVADSTPVDGTPSTGTDAFAVVDETPVSLVDYNEITVAGGEDRFTFGALGFTPLEVLAVRTMSDMTAEGSITDGRGVVRSGGVDLYGTNRAIATGGTYAIVGDIFPLDPSGNPWTGTTVDGIIAGYEAN